MLPPRPLVVARCSAGAFALVASLSLLNGTTEWTAAYRGLAAAIITVVIAPFLYNSLERLLTPTEVLKTNENSKPAMINNNTTGQGARTGAARAS
ncbi:MAG: hypothetical protein HY286_19320 [Planctomycetes bacterium]|nr:hypothetical protein [Planctomycetota bacterium]